MTFNQNCRVCGARLTAECPDDYQFNASALLPSLTCNHCYDVRDRHLRLLEWINDRLSALTLCASQSPLRAKLRIGLEAALTRLAQVSADRSRSYNRVTLAEVQTALNCIMDSPDTSGDTLANFQDLCRTRHRPQVLRPKPVVEN